MKSQFPLNIAVIGLPRSGCTFGARELTTEASIAAKLLAKCQGVEVVQEQRKVRGGRSELRHAQNSAWTAAQKT